VQRDKTAKAHIFRSSGIAKYALVVVLTASLSAVFTSATYAQTVSTVVQDKKTAKQPEFSKLNEQQRLRILIQMIRSGAFDEAERLLKTHPLKGDYSANRTLFLEGIIAKGRKQYEIAVQKFRAALASDPKLTMVRAELAHTLFITGQDDGAKHHFQLLSGAAPNRDLATQFDRFIEAVDARRPWRLSAYFSIAPSTNFNNGTNSRLIPFGGGFLVVNDNSRKKSGIGVRGGANASYTFDVGKDLSLVVGAGVNIVEYTGNTFDDRVISQNISLIRRDEKGQVSIGLSASQRRVGEDEIIVEGGPHISMARKLTNKVQFYTKLRYLRTNFKDSDYRDGSTMTLDNRLSYAVGPDTVFYMLSGGQRTKTELDHLDFLAAYGGVALYRELPLGITLYAEGKLTKKYFDGDFPLLNEPQIDTRMDVVASFTKRDFNFYGFAPRVEYIYTNSTSNTPFAEYSSHGVNLTLTKAF